MAASSAFVVASSIRLRRFGTAGPPGRSRRRAAAGTGPGRGARQPSRSEGGCCHARDELRTQRQRPDRGRRVQGRAGAPGADRAADLRACSGWPGSPSGPGLPAAAAGAGAAPAATARPPAEPAWRRLLRIGFGLLWVFDGILQAQPKMAVGLPSQVIEPTAASSPHWVQHLVNWAGTTWSYHPMQAGASAVWIQVGIGLWLLVAAARPAVPAGRAGQRRLGPGGLGVRRVLRRDLRPRPDLAVRRARRGADLRGRRRADRAARAGLADARRLGRLITGRDRAVPGRHGGAAGLAGPRVLAGHRARPARHPGRHDPDDGPDLAAAVSCPPGSTPSPPSTRRTGSRSTCSSWPRSPSSARRSSPAGRG